MRILLRSKNSCTCSCVLEQTSIFFDIHAVCHLLDLLLANVQYRSCKINVRPCSVALLPNRYEQASIFESLHLFLHVAVRSPGVIGLCCKHRGLTLLFLCITFPTHVRQRCVYNITALIVRGILLYASAVLACSVALVMF